MSLSPNSELVRRTIDLNYANKQRAISLKWSVINGVILLLFTYDLWSKCAQHTSPLHYAELALALAAGAALARHACRLLPRREPPALSLTPRQRRLLGLTSTRLDSSFELVEGSGAAGAAAEPGGGSDSDSGADALSLSLSLSRDAGRPWRGDESPSPRSPRSPSSPRSPRSPPSPFTPPSPLTPPAHRWLSGGISTTFSEGLLTDEFISDHHSLNNYLKQYEERSEPQRSPAGGGEWAAPRRAAPYQLAAVDADGGKAEECDPSHSPQVWWRLHIDPQRLTQWNFNLRLWIHVTILERLVREMEAVDEALAAHGPPDVRLGQAPAERLRQAAAALAAAPASASAAASLAALLPYVEPFANQRYVVRRIRELARGGCLSEYRWSGGGSEWADGEPTDAELVLHLFTTYLDGQAPAAGAAHVSSAGSAAGGAAPRGPGTLAVHRASARPPHYVLLLGAATLEAGRGRNNLLHTLLLFLAAAARAQPPPAALRRLHLGPAGLNMLWIIGR